MTGKSLYSCCIVLEQALLDMSEPAKIHLYLTLLLHEALHLLFAQQRHSPLHPLLQRLCLAGAIPARHVLFEFALIVASAAQTLF